MRSIGFCLLLRLCLALSSSSPPSRSVSALPGGAGTAQGPPKTCLKDDLPCERDRAAFQVISELHAQLDDDKDGGVDPSEADGFLREELAYGTGSPDRSRGFYRTDRHVSVAELWGRWKRSAVHNWTGEEVLQWLQHHVELPQYANAFRQQRIDGASLPKLAAAGGHFVASVLQVRNPVHRQKILLKAVDAILFGAPLPSHSHLKDGVLAALLLVSVGGCWFAYIQYKRSQAHLANMTQELDALSRKEESLMEVTQKLVEAERRQENDLREKSQLEERYRREVEEARAEASKVASERQSTAEVQDRLRLALEEMSLVKKMLAEAERKLELGPAGCPAFSGHSFLQLLLQLTYETEVHHHSIKRRDAEHQLQSAKENCEKVRRKRAAFMGSLRIAHSGTLDDVDRSITEAQAALEEVKTDLQERQFRWSQLEEITGLSILCNPGLPALRQAFRAARSGTLPSAATDSPLPSTAHPQLLRQDCVEEAPPLRPQSHLSLPTPPAAVDGDLTPTNAPRRAISEEAAAGRPQFSVDDSSSQSSQEEERPPTRSLSTDLLAPGGDNSTEAKTSLSGSRSHSALQSLAPRSQSNPLKKLLHRRRKANTPSS